jgi:ABC-type uncharacterized transport system substrate-binding protein
MERNLFSQFTVFIFLLIFLKPLQLHAEMKQEFRVLVIHSYQAGMWTTESTNGIRNFFQDRKIAVNIRDRIFDYYLYQSQGASKVQAEARRVHSEALEFKPHLIIIFDDEAADTLTSRLNDLRIPIVLSGINKSKDLVSWWIPEGNPKRYFTGTWERYPFAQSLRMLNRINPKILKIALLTGSNESAKVITNQLETFFKENGGQYSDIRYEKTFMSSNWSDWREAIKNYKGSDRAFWIVSPWNINDENGKEIPLMKISEFLEKNCLPISLSFLDL